MSAPDRDPDEADADVVELFPLVAPSAALAVPDDDPVEELPRGRLATWAAEVAERPLALPVVEWKARACWWRRVLARDAAWLLTHPHRPLLAQVPPVRQGVKVTWRAWRRWCAEADLAERIRETPKDSPGRLAAEKDRAKLRGRHRRLTTVVVVPLLIGGTVVALWRPLWLAPIVLVVLAVLDWVGRRHPDPGQAPPPRRRTLLEEGAPLGALAAQIVNRLTEDGVRVTPASPMTVHPGGEYRITVTHEDEITAKHLRSLERALAARPRSIRCIGAGDDAGASQLRLPTRDHLAQVPSRPWAPTGSRSIADPAPLWMRDDGDPSMPTLAGIHLDLVGTTGAGKTEALQELISLFGECRDVYPVFADLTMGPVGPLNRRVLRRAAYTVTDVDALLDWVLARVHERHLELHRLAESDDDAPVEWDLTWGPQIQLVVDEYSFLAEQDELHGKVEQIMRIGRKVKVCVIRASQRSGNRDLGSTVAQALVGLKVLMACTERDTTSMLSTGHRDQGWSPHLFRPAVPGDARDAGRCYVFGPAHRTPEIHRFHAPLPPGEVKRRDRRRAEDGLPNLDGTPAGERPAILLSPVQEGVEAIFAEHGVDWLPTRVLLDDLGARGHKVHAGALGDELGNCGSRQPWDGVAQVRGYAITDVRRAWEG